MTRCQFNRIYEAYARAHGHTPAEMLDHDKNRWPGGCMAGYLLWLPDRIRAWASMVGHPRANDPNEPLFTDQLMACHEWIATTPQPPLEGEPCQP